MRMRKRIGSLVLAALMLTLLTPAALAVGTVLKVNVPATLPKAGEEFTVTVDITGNPGFNSVGFAVAFEHDKLECTEARAGALLSNALFASNPNAQNGVKLGAASATQIVGDGTVAVLSFKAKEDLSSYPLSLMQAKVSDEDGNILYQSEDLERPAQSDPPKTPTSAASASSAAPAQPTQTTQPTQPEQPTPTPKATFPDTAEHWGAEWIETAAERGLFKGYPDGSFRPDAEISRADYLLVLWRMSGEPESKSFVSFPDVSSDAYYAEAVAWAYEQGFVNGKGSGFAPLDSLTRQEAMKILFAVSGGKSGMEAMLGGLYDQGFTDSDQIAPWAKPAMYWAVYNKIINGTSDTTLSPEGTATRAQLAKILVEYQNQFQTASK